MSLPRLLIAGLCLAAGSGCFSARSSAPDSFFWQAARNATQQPHRHHDDAEFVKVTKARAEAAWAQVCAAGGAASSKPYHEGFVDGFVDYVEAGGSGEPPYLPPFRYRMTEFRTAEGIAAIQDWYAGFRHGAGVAKESGLRELNYVPLPGPAVPADARAVEPAPTFAADPPALSPWERPGAPPQIQPRPDDKLPPPRVVPDAPTLPGFPVPPGRPYVPEAPKMPDLSRAATLRAPNPGTP